MNSKMIEQRNRLDEKFARMTPAERDAYITGLMALYVCLVKQQEEPSEARYGKMQ